ncbi:MAG: Cna B-type domain-containing protein [Clostridiales bacterium]|nr:Cna B-type domain-containing protein [Clostridiales bacterium]
MSKWNRNLLRRMSALLMCLCMLLGNVNITLADEAYVFFSEPIQPIVRKSAAAAASVPLQDYTTYQFDLWADRNQTSLPEIVEDGQSLFFQMAFDLINTADGAMYQLRQDYIDGKIDANTVFTCDIGFLPLLQDTKYPTSYDSPDNQAIDDTTGIEVFRWWVDEAGKQICLSFSQEIMEDNGTISGAKLSFEGHLNTDGKDDNGELNFGVNEDSVSLVARQGYALNKAAGTPYFSTDAGTYLVDYTVTLSLEQNMSLSSIDGGGLYHAALTLEDTVVSGGALTGTLYGSPVVTAPEGEAASVTVANSGVVNTMTIASPDNILNKGTYTIVYRMKVEQNAALNKLSGYSDAQKTNTVELKENGSSLKKALTAAAKIAWDKVTENQFQIDKNVFLEKGPDYAGVYYDEDAKKYYVDFRVVVYVREPVQTFTVTDKVNYAMSFRTPDEVPAMLEGVDVSETYWSNDIHTATLSPAPSGITVVNQIENGANVVTVTAAPGAVLQPGAYHLRLPADVTGAVEKTLSNVYPQTYSNTAYLTSVDGQSTTESKEYKQAIPKYDETIKDGGYEVNSNGEIILYNGKPVIRWDVYFGWNFYNTITFVDSMTNMELLVNSTYPFEIHSFTNRNTYKERLASLTSATDTSYITFTEALDGFTFNNKTLGTNADQSSVKLYKLVYFTQPVEAENAAGYVTDGLKNSYVIDYKSPFGEGFKGGPVPGESEPTLSSAGRLFVKKTHVIEINDLLTKWKITADNQQKKIPFANFGELAIVDVVPRNQSIGEVTVEYNEEWPFVVELTCNNKAKTKVTLEEGTHYSIVRKLEGYDFGENGKHGFAVILDMEAVAEVLEANEANTFLTIDVYCYLRNERQPYGKNYELKNDGGLSYTTNGFRLQEYINGKYSRGFSTKRKEKPLYGDYYDPDASKTYTDHTGGTATTWNSDGAYDTNASNGDGKQEILWKIFIGAREFENNPDPVVVTITDTMSDNLMFPTYEGKELADLFLIESEDLPGHTIQPDFVTLDGQTFTLQFTVPGGRWTGVQNKSCDVYITYHTVIKPEALMDALDSADEAATEVVLSYSNTATLEWNGDAHTIPDSSGSQTFKTMMLGKSAEIVSAVSEIEYKIVINENGLPLNNGNPLVLEDELGAGKDSFLYRDDSVTLVNLDTGDTLAASSQVTDHTYTITWAKGDTKGFTISVPDEQRLQLTYRVKPLTGIGDKTPELINSASLNGKTDSNTQNSFQVSASNQEATYTPAPGNAAIAVRKLEGDSSVEVLLQGAVFEVYAVNADGTLGDLIYLETEDGEQTPARWTTDGLGKFRAEFPFNRFDTVICLKEVQAPAGYTISETGEWYFYFSTKDAQYANDAVKATVEKLNADGKHVQQAYSDAVYQLNVENMPVTCDLRIEKISDSGASLDGAEFILQNAKGDQISGPSVAEENGVFAYVFSDLKSGDYTLTETKAPEGYELGEQSQWSITLDSVSSSVSINWAEGTSDTLKGYVTCGTQNGAAVLTVINDEIPVMDVIVEKQWDDVDNAFSMRPESITVYLWQNNTDPDEDDEPYDAAVIVPDQAGSWNHIFAGLLVYDENDLPYTYTVTEEAVTGYTTSIDQAESNDGSDDLLYQISNRLDTVDITVEKIWDDAGNQAGKRPEQITFSLLHVVDAQSGETTPVLMNGVPYHYTMNAPANNPDTWSYTFASLPKYDAQGNEIDYIVSEEVAYEDGFEYSNDSNNLAVVDDNDPYSMTLTNSYTPATTSATVKKVWDDANNQDGKRPESLTVTLSNGESVTLNEANGWTATIDNLPKYADGEEIEYTWTEGEMPEGYSLTDSSVNGTVTTLTNSYTPATTSATVKKVWDDANNQDGKQPESLTVTLSNGQSVTLNEANGWTATIDNLPRYADGEEIEYTWMEGEMPEGYSLTHSSVNGTVTTLTNSYTPATTSATVKKVWDDANNQDGKRPESLTVTLSNGESVTLNEANGWTATIDNLPKYADGEEIEYTWTEGEMPEGYSLTDSSVNGTVTTLTNSYTPATTSATVKKVWDDANNQDGKRPESLTVTLSNGESVTLNEANGWTATIDNLPKYADGEEIKYTWTEGEMPAGYSLTDTSVSGTVTTLTNSYTPDTTEVTGTKTWIDADNQDGIRPASITINLLADGTVVDTVTVSEAEAWKWSFTDLPKYAAGVEISYTITEETVPGYTAEVKGHDVTNTHEPETVDITGSKTWNDIDNYYLKRPESITIRLYADGVAIDSKVVSKADNWRWTFAELPVYKAGAVGRKINYTISEDSVAGYTTTLMGNNVRNSLNLVEFIKLDEQTGKPLPGAQFALYEGGAATAGLGRPVETWTSGTSSKILTGLKVGQTYTIVETKAPAGFVPMTPFVFTVELTDVPGSYRRFSASNCHEYRFRKLDGDTYGIVSGAYLAIMQGDTEIESWVTSDSNDGWYSVADHRMVTGVEYTLVEKLAPSGYLTAEPIHFTISPENGMLVVNGENTNKATLIMYDNPIPNVTSAPQTTSLEITVTKRWEDKDNILGLRPEKITVYLYQKERSADDYPAEPYMTVEMMSNGENEWTFTFSGLPRTSSSGFLYDYMAMEEEVPGYTVRYLNNGRTIINAIPEEDYPPTPTPTLPNVTPTPTPTGRVPYGVRMVDGEWVYIDEYGMPLGSVPVTGDETNFVLWGMAVALPMLAAALAAVEIRRRKKVAAARRQSAE